MKNSIQIQIFLKLITICITIIMDVVREVIEMRWSSFCSFITIKKKVLKNQQLSRSHVNLCVIIKKKVLKYQQLSRSHVNM